MPTNTHLAASDLVREAYLSLVARPGRALLTAAGTIIGIGALVAVLGLAGTASGQVSASFDALQATTVIGVDTRPDDGETLPFPFTSEALGRAERLNGVNGVGALYAPITADTVAGPNPSVPDPQPLPLMAVSSGLWEAVGVKEFRGRLTDEGLAEASVTVLGAGAAEALGLRGLAHPTTIEIGGRPFTVIGIVDELERRSELRAAVMVPLDTAMQIWGVPGVAEKAEVIVATEQGAALQVADELRWAIVPGAPDTLSIEQPPDPRQLRESVSSTLQGLLLGLGAVALAIGTFGIANSTLVSVMERRQEIALRRALGATKPDIASQIALESALLGAVGGLAGATLGMYAVIGIALARGWSPIVNLELVLVAPLVGALTGVIAGLYPAYRAASIEPAQALRAG